MVIRIRFGKGPKVVKNRHARGRVAVLLVALLQPAAAMALALALWKIAADLNWTNRFAISSGPFSHWQLWLGAAVALQLLSKIANRGGKKRTAATQ